MGEFNEKAASKRSLSLRKSVCGVGVNDAWYITQYKDEEGKLTMCPYYRKWFDMLRRCYSERFHEGQHTYRGCSVSSGWLLFSNFRLWMEQQDWEGKQLDKDILVVGNKVYSEYTCIFVSSGINSLLSSCGAVRGECSQGVSLYKKANKYRAYCRINGMLKHLGYFISEAQAEEAYCEFKSANILRMSNQPEAASQPRLQEGLLRHAKVFSDRAEELTVQLK